MMVTMLMTKIFIDIKVEAEVGLVQSCEIPNFVTQKANSEHSMTYNPGLKTEFHISGSNLPKTILDFAKLFILPDFLP